MEQVLPICDTVDLMCTHHYVAPRSMRFEAHSWALLSSDRQRWSLFLFSSTSRSNSSLEFICLVFHSFLSQSRNHSWCVCVWVCSCARTLARIYLRYLQSKYFKQQEQRWENHQTICSFENIIVSFFFLTLLNAQAHCSLELTVVRTSFVCI